MVEHKGIEPLTLECKTSMFPLALMPHADRFTVSFIFDKETGLPSKLKQRRLIPIHLMRSKYLDYGSYKNGYMFSCLRVDK